MHVVEIDGVPLARDVAATMLQLRQPQWTCTATRDCWLSEKFVSGSCSQPFKQVHVLSQHYRSILLQPPLFSHA
jgi:hypothetical protein